MIKNKKTRKNSKRRTKNRQRRSRKVMRGGMGGKVPRTYSSGQSPVEKSKMREESMAARRKSESIASAVPVNKWAVYAAQDAKKAEQTEKTRAGLEALQKMGFAVKM